MVVQVRHLNRIVLYQYVDRINMYLLRNLTKISKNYYLISDVLMLNMEHYIGEILSVVNKQIDIMNKNYGINSLANYRSVLTYNYLETYVCKS